MSRDEQLYCLAADVEIVRRKSSLLLVSKLTGASVRVSDTAEPLLPLLSRGTDMPGLRKLLQELHPQAFDISKKLGLFLESLERVGLLVNEQAAVQFVRGRRKIKLFQVDRMAHLISTLLLKIPQVFRIGIMSALILGALVGIAQLAVLNNFPSGRGLVQDFSILGFLIFIFLVVPFHEAAHAVACRMAGVEVGSAGLVFHGGLLPGPFVETTQAYRVKGRWARFCIPAMGPVVNLLGAGVCAWILLLVVPDHTEYKTIVNYVFMLCLLFVYLDTNPFTPSDGSHMLEALLDDELARHNSLSFKKMNHYDRGIIVRYRIVSLLHAVIGIFLLYLWFA